MARSLPPSFRRSVGPSTTVTLLELPRSGGSFGPRGLLLFFDIHHQLQKGCARRGGAGNPKNSILAPRHATGAAVSTIYRSHYHSSQSLPLIAVTTTYRWRAADLHPATTGRRR